MFLLRIDPEIRYKPVSLAPGVLAYLMCLAFACVLSPQAYAQLPTDKTPNPKPKSPSPKNLRGEDVLATIEGEPIRRREFTEFWLKVDNQASRPLGAALLERLRAGGRLKPSYALTEKDLYQTLYSQPAETYATFLSNLVTNRLVAREATRRGIVVTHAEAEQAGRALLQQAREQQGLKLPDDAILSRFHVPRDLFLEEMTFRLRAERLLADSIAHKNGHPLRPDDWISLRELFAGANLGADTQKNAQEFADAKTRLQKWADEVREGKPFVEVAGAHNEDETRSQGGLRGAALRGTGTQAIEETVFQLKSGQMSAPLRTKDGWYIFLAEQRGAQIPAGEREAAWKAIVEKRLTPYLADMRKHARITSAIPLPNDTVSASPAAQAANK